jgi:hypothetical protein
MATVFRHKHHPLAGMAEGVPCFNCGSDKPSAAWCGGVRTIAICRECVNEVLPGLLADCYVGEHNAPFSLVQHLLREFVSRFWRAVVIAKERVHEATDKETVYRAVEQHRNGVPKNGRGGNHG